jgi:hypothetical protein
MDSSTLKNSGALFDLSWFFYLGVISTYALQLVLFCIAVLVDDRPQPIFPRWLGYANLWLAMTLVPASFLVFFKTGPLAWNGLFIFWIPVAAVATWLVLNSVYLLKAVGSDVVTEGCSLEREIGELRARLDRLAPRDSH